MMDFVSDLDSFDLFVFALVLIGALYFAYKYLNSRYNPEPKMPNISAISLSNSSMEDQNFITKMKNSGRSVAIFYGSQTGTAEELAGRLAKDAKRYGLKALVLDPEECEMEDLPQLADVENSLAIFCMATYGEGDPTDNAQQFFEFLQNGGGDMAGVKYAVFGLGNKTYEHFNAMGIFTDSKLEELGAERLHSLGTGDDDGNLEEDFMRWRESFWPRVCETFDLQAGEEVSMRQYRLETLEPGDYEQSQIFKGEIGRLGSFGRQRPPFDPKNPFLAPVAINKELHKDGGRSCKHVEFDIEGSRLRYEAGDHLGIFATNDLQLVQSFAQLLNTDLDSVFKLINVDEDSSKKNPFPCPCSYRTALTHYVDITSPLKSHVIKELVNYTTDEKEKEHLQLLSSTQVPPADANADPKSLKRMLSEEGLTAYRSYIYDEHRSVIDVLREHPSCQPPLDHLLELLPRLHVRYYSISSSPKAATNRVAVTAVVVNYNIDDRTIKGVCTNYLAEKQIVGDERPKVPVFVRKSTLRLPHRLNTPVIMIGPGTGFAPFRGFLQDRHATKLQGKEIGPMYIYFGCRRRDEDFIYEDELNEWKESGTLTQLNVAFSREQEHKVYVQHLLWENRENAWKMIDKEQAHIYVCGDARSMAHDVLATFKRMAIELGGKTEQQANQLMKDMERQKRYQADVWS